MRLHLARAPRLPAWPAWAVGLTLLWLGLVGVVHLLDPAAPLCGFKRVSGVPCPGCGLTRGVTALARGEVLGGLAFNPLLLTALLLFLLLLGVRLLLGRAPRLDLGPRERRLALLAALLLVVANWAYLVVRGV
jgi:hypothetical protein